LAGLRASLTDSIAIGIVAGLVVGKAAGITGTVALLTRSRKFVLDATIGSAELVGMSFVAGIGFTVALLVGDLAYGEASIADGPVKVGVLVGSLIAASIGATILGIRNRHHRRQRPTG
jgi:NhaA family Na+:H+ antiporter